MNAPQRVAAEAAAPDLRRIDRVRHATKRRARRTRRRMHRPVLAVVTLAVAVLVPLLAVVLFLSLYPQLALHRSERSVSATVAAAPRRKATVTSSPPS